MPTVRNSASNSIADRKVMGFHGALDVGGAVFELALPMIAIWFAMMVLPSGGAAYVFPGKGADIPFFLVKA